MKKFRFLFVLVLLTPALAWGTVIDHMYVFGDSLSDNGNLYQMNHGKLPKTPYYNGRFSNGPVWVEDLTALVGFSDKDLEDYAIGGAQAGRGMFNKRLEKQIKRFEMTHKTADPDSLYVIWIGANNYFYHPHEKETKAQRTVDNIEESILRLHEKGAEHFLVINLPDLGKTPWAVLKDEKHKNDKYSKHLTDLTQAHNKALADALVSLKETTDLDIVSLDAYSLFNQVENAPTSYRLKDVTTPCFQGNFKGDPDIVCNDPNLYLFWDKMHPTLVVHHDLAELALKKLYADNMKFDASHLAA